MDKHKLTRYINVASNEEVRYLCKALLEYMTPQQINETDELFNTSISLKANVFGQKEQRQTEQPPAPLPVQMEQPPIPTPAPARQQQQQQQRTNLFQE